MERKKKGKGGIKGVGDKEKGGWRKGKGGILCSCDFSSGKTLEKNDATTVGRHCWLVCAGL